MGNAACSGGDVNCCCRSLNSHDIVVVVAVVSVAATIMATIMSVCVNVSSDFVCYK